jgi:hypothetical protein
VGRPRNNWSPSLQFQLHETLLAFRFDGLGSWHGGWYLIIGKGEFRAEHRRQCNENDKSHRGASAEFHHNDFHHQ